MALPIHPENDGIPRTAVLQVCDGDFLLPHPGRQY